MSEQLAVIRNICVRQVDHIGPAITFDAYIDEGTAALQVLNWADAAEFVKAYVYDEDIHKANGKPCWVEVGIGIIRYARAWKHERSAAL